MSIAHPTRIQCCFENGHERKSVCSSILVLITSLAFPKFGLPKFGKINRFDHFLLQIHKGMSLPIRKSTRNDISRQVLNAYKLIKIGYYYKLYKLCNIKIEY